MSNIEQHSHPSVIRVLVVDDSPFRRQTLQSVLDSVSDIEVIGTAANGQEAIDKTLSLHPDVITMDVQMPIMNGFEAIDHIMRRDPKPIIVISGIDVNTIVKALSMGAMDFVSIQQDFTAVMEDLIDKIRIAARVQPIRRMDIAAPLHPVLDSLHQDIKVIAIGVSTGGPAALTQLFQILPPYLPIAMVVVQHISTGFIHSFVDHLHSCSSYDISVAQPGRPLEKGTVLFAPDDQHLRFDRNRRVELIGEPDTRGHHLTSIDMMMTSVAQVFDDKVIGVLMTGMGQDGVKGMTAIKEAGGVTIAQNEQTSTVYGMNRVAIERGVVDYVLPLADIGRQIAHLSDPTLVSQWTLH